MSTSCLREAKEGVLLEILATPKAKKSAVLGEHDGALKVALQAIPEDGAANEELIRFMSKLFKVPKKDIEILRGHASRKKQLLIRGKTVLALATALLLD